MACVNTYICVYSEDARIKDARNRDSEIFGNRYACGACFEKAGVDGADCQTDLILRHVKSMRLLVMFITTHCHSLVSEM